MYHTRHLRRQSSVWFGPSVPAHKVHCQSGLFSNLHVEMLICKHVSGCLLNPIKPPTISMFASWEQQKMLEAKKRLNFDAEM